MAVRQLVEGEFPLPSSVTETPLPSMHLVGGGGEENEASFALNTAPFVQSWQMTPFEAP